MVSIQESVNWHNPRDEGGEGDEGDEGDEKTHEAVPRDGHDKTERAVEVMRNLDIKRVFVLKVLKKLHKQMGDAMWDIKEEHLHETLADAIMEHQSKANRNGKCQPEVTGTAEGRAVPPHRPTETNLNQNGYCHTSLKVLAHRHITQLGGNLPQGVGNVENSWKPSLEKKPSSFVHSKEGLAYHPDDPGRGAKRQDQPEVKPAAIGRHECVQKKLKQPKEELDMVGSSELRKRFVPLKGYKRLKRPHEEELGEQNGNYEDEEIEPERPNHDWEDLSRGCETIPIPVVNHSNSKSLPPKFFYISSSKVAEKAHVNFSLHRIVDSDCCSDCFKDCLTAPHPCACARYTGGEFAYTTGGCLRKPYIEKVIRNKLDDTRKEYCLSGFHCPEVKNEDNPVCKGHLTRDFVKECCTKCGCSKNCGNRVVQRGITRKLEVFMTPEGKGWGIRTLEDLPAGAFAFEYVGEILTNTEMFHRNEKLLKSTMQGEITHTFPVTLDADWGTEKLLEDETALCLDATFFGNVARFLNHRCHDGNLLDLPVQIETSDHHYYHVAFFTNRPVKAMEELTWDYGIDFDDTSHPIPAFHCLCGSQFCRGNRSDILRHEC